MGAVGALVMALGKKRLDKSLLTQALDNTAKLSSFVLFILIGSTVFSFTFNAADGHIWVEHLFDKVPGGVIGFLIVVNILVFILGMFIDFFEIAFIVIPLLAPVAEKMGIDLIWFGVIIAMNLQTSFLTPPFGFALFYLRSVAPEGLHRPRHGPDHPGRDHGPDLQGLDRLHHHAADHGGHDHGLPRPGDGHRHGAEPHRLEVMQQLDIRPPDAGEAGDEAAPDADKPDSGTRNSGPKRRKTPAAPTKTP